MQLELLVGHPNNMYGTFILCANALCILNIKMTVTDCKPASFHNKDEGPVEIRRLKELIFVLGTRKVSRDNCDEKSVSSNHSPLSHSLFPSE